MLEQLGNSACAGHVDGLKIQMAFGVAKSQVSVRTQRSSLFRMYRKESLASSLHITDGERPLGQESELVGSCGIGLTTSREGEWGGCGDGLGCSGLRAQREHAADTAGYENQLDECRSKFFTILFTIRFTVHGGAPRCAVS